MTFHIITIFPEIFNSYLNESIIKRAQKNKLIEIKIHNLREFSSNKHKKVDDRPYGGGPGMVMQIQPIIKAIEFAKSKVKSPAKGEIRQKRQRSKIILFTPSGKQFDNKKAKQLAKKYDNLILICGRYEGVDERIKKIFKVEELSIGSYVLTGGELPAMVLVDSISRQIPGVLGKTESIEEKRLGIGVPAYTRPEIFKYKGKKYAVPKILLSGNPKKIEEWKRTIQKNL